MFNYNIWKSKWAIIVSLAIVVVVVWGQTAWFDYVQLDEGILLINNRPFISDINNFFEVFKHDINYPSATAPYYRPIFVLSFMLNSQFGTSPMAYHVINIILHVVAAWAVFVLLQELGARKKIAAFFSVLFAIHPAVTPVVAWIPGRIEAILTIFIAVSFVAFMRFLKTGKWQSLIIFLSSFGLALFTKEVALALLPLLLIYYFVHREEKGSELIFTLGVGTILIAAAWFFIRKAVLAETLNDLSFLQMASVLWANLSGLLLYLGKAILPFNLTTLPIFESSAIIYGIIVAIILAGYWFISKFKFSSPSVLGLAWFLLFLLPSLVSYNLPERMVFFEHRLYLPLIGIIIFFATSEHLNGLNLKRFRYLLPGLALIVLFGFMSWNYSSAYRDKTAFWQKAVLDSSSLDQAHNGLATAYLMDGKIQEAMLEFAKTLEINPKAKRIHLLLGLYYLDQGQVSKAADEFNRELEVDPGQFVAYHNLGRIYAQEKKNKEAEAQLLKALEINPDYILARQDLVVLYFSQNKHQQAIVHIKELTKRQTLDSLHPQIIKILEIYAKETASKLGF